MRHLKIAGLSIGYTVPEPSGPILPIDPGPWLNVIGNETGQEPESVEFYALSVALGEVLPLYGRLQTHGVAIEYGGMAYIPKFPCVHSVA